MTVVEELVSVLGLEIGEGALATLSEFKTAVNAGLAGVGGIVAALSAAFAGTVYSVAELGNEINTTSRKLGVSTDALQELKYAADLSNVSFESLSVGMRYLSKNAAEGGDAAKRVFEAFSGVQMRDAQGNLKTADVLLEDFADKVAKTKDPIKQVELAMHALHGQSGSELLPLLKQGKEGIQRLRMEARDLGLVLDKETIASSNRFVISLKKLKNSLFGIRNTLGAPFIDDFADGLDYVTEKVYAARLWFMSLTKQIRDLGQHLKLVTDMGKKAFEAIRRGIEGLGIDKVAEAVDWADLLKAALIGIGVVATATAVATAASWLLAAAPFLLIATLIGLIVDDIANFVAGQDSVIGRAQEWAKTFNVNDGPGIQFMKRLLDLLFDLGDPKKWARVGQSAKEGFMPFLEWLKPLFDVLDVVNHPAQSLAHKLSQTSNLPAGAIDDKNRKPFEATPAELAAMSEDQYEAWKKRQQQAQDFSRFRSGKKISGPAASQLHAQGYINDYDFNRLRYGEGGDKGAAVQQNVVIHVHDATDPQKVAEHVRRELDAAHSDAKAAIAAHPNGS